ncbi:MAG: magnesium transporter [Paracoccaceae bacterium]|nr:magnesium transporter [Paracoccaceae bacterium]MDE2675901.1 magnesium transporter [Paracoccaceae bacterium]
MVENISDSETSYELNPNLVESVLSAIETEDRALLKQLFKDIHEADIADLLEQFDADTREGLITLWGSDFDLEVLSEVEEKIRDEIVSLLHPNQIASSVGDLESDDIVDIVEDLETKQQDIFLGALDETELAAVQMSLNYPEDTAGRLMQRKLVMLPEGWNVGQAIDKIRSSENLPEEFYHILVVSPKIAPLYQVSLGRLMSSHRNVDLALIADEDFRTFPVLEDQHDVAYAFNQYHLISAPVVDENGRVVGVITIDDAMGVLDEEAEEDLMRLGGVGDESLTDRVFGITRQRLPWLLINLVTAILASMVIAQFTETIEAIVALAVLMPIVASMGGNAGTQSLTVAVRALATKDLTGLNSFRVIRREFWVGLINGIMFALIVGGIGYFWFGDTILGIVLGLAMVVNMVVAGLSGILIPLALEKVDIDPAVASSVFVTTVTDVIGFFAFLGLAATVLL